MGRSLSFPAGEVRTGFVIAAALTAVAQSAVIGSGAGSGWPALALTAVCAGLVYLLFVNLTKRKLGAPLMAAVLFGAHPSLAPTLTEIALWRSPAGTALALLAGILLARTPLQPKLLWPSLAAFAASLPLAPGGAAIPFIVAAAIVAYHGLDPARLATKRLAPRFLVFLLPLAAWIAGTFIDPDPARPQFGAVPAFAIHAVLPFGASFGASSVAGAVIAAACALFGIVRLRATPKAAWPLLAFGVSLAAAALIPDAWNRCGAFTAALAFAALLAAEGIEEIFYRFGAAVAMPLLVIVYAAFAVQSHASAIAAR